MKLASSSISMSRKPRDRKARDDESAAITSARCCSCSLIWTRKASTCVGIRLVSVGHCRALGFGELACVQCEFKRRSLHLRREEVLLRARLQHEERGSIST